MDALAELVLSGNYDLLKKRCEDIEFDVISPFLN